jgi:hypothetical protein
LLSGSAVFCPVRRQGLTLKLTRKTNEIIKMKWWLNFFMGLNFIKS